MPLFRAGGRLGYFAHVPKCGGTAVERHLAERFGPLGLLDDRHLARDPARTWTRTSPQHIDWASLQPILPAAMLDAVFAVVRHPLARAVSAWRFQTGVEGTAPAGISFGGWLDLMAERAAADPFAIDNHFRPQGDFMPQDATIFRLEHGLDAIVPWLDAFAGDERGPRFVAHHRPGKGGGATGPAVAPTAAGIARVAELWAEDFARFGYAPDRAEPLAPPPALDPAVLDRAREARARAAHPARKFAARVRRGIARRLS